MRKFILYDVTAVFGRILDVAATLPEVIRCVLHYSPLVFWSHSISQLVAIAADLNGDGKPDIAVTGSGVVSVLLNNGEGTFAPPVSYAVGDDPVSVAAADLNGDGRPDPAVANFYSDRVSILLNAGDGTFLPSVSCATNLQPDAVAIGDFNGDGVPDLTVLAGATLSFFAGTGRGTFQMPVSFAVGIPHDASFGVADLNDDESPDIVVCFGTKDISVLLNRPHAR